MTRTRQGASNSSALSQNTTTSRENNPYAEGTRYYTMYNNNPYSEEKRTRKRTIWDALANALGFRSGFDIYTDQANQAMNEEDARIAEAQGLDEYNSAEEVAKREKAAGINSDLVGLAGAEGVQTDKPDTAPDLSGGDDMERVGNLFNGIAQAVTIASGMTADIAKTIGLFADNTAKKINNAQGIDELATNFLLDNVSSAGDEIVNNDNWQGQLLTGLFGEDGKSGFAKKWAEDRGLTKRQTKQFMQTAYARLANNKGMIYKKWREGLQERSDYYKTRGSKWTAQSDSFTETMDAFKPLIDAMDGFIENDAKAKAKHAENDVKYEETISPELKAEAENKENEWKKENTELMKNMKKAFSDVMQNLTQRAEAGDKFAWFLTLILPTLYQKFMG